MGTTQFLFFGCGAGLVLLFCWTGVPSIIAFIEFIIYAVTNEEKLQEKYSSANPNIVAVVLALGIGAIFRIGILAALAIPKFTDASAKAKMSEAPVVLASYENAQLAHLAETGALGGLNELVFEGPVSKWFDYYGSKNGSYSAQAKENIGIFPQGGTLTASVDVNGDVTHSFSGSSESTVKKYLPTFFE